MARSVSPMALVMDSCSSIRVLSRVCKLDVTSLIPEPRVFSFSFWAATCSNKLSYVEEDEEVEEVGKSPESAEVGEGVMGVMGAGPILLMEDGDHGLP